MNTLYIIQNLFQKLNNFYVFFMNNEKIIIGFFAGFAGITSVLNAIEKKRDDILI